MSENRIFGDTTLHLHFDARGKDPDRFSPTKRSHHRELWIKPLPNGAMFDLEDVYPKGYLLHRSGAGRMMMSSDTIIRRFRNHRGMSTVIGQIPESDRAAFSRLGYTIGGMSISAISQVDGNFTVNQKRGINRRIGNRFALALALALALECIRRHYADGGASPLAAVLARYSTSSSYSATSVAMWTSSCFRIWSPPTTLRDGSVPHSSVSTNRRCRQVSMTTSPTGASRSIS